MYLGRWRQSWPGLEDLARTNKLAARSEAGHVSWLISGRIRFPFVHATLPSLASSRSGFPFTFGNLNFWRLAVGQAPAPSNFSNRRDDDTGTQKRSRLSNTFSYIFSFFLFFFPRREPVSCSQWNNRITLDWKYRRAPTSCGVIGEDYEVLWCGESSWEMIGFDHIVYRFRIGAGVAELLLMAPFVVIFLVISSI